MILILIFGLIHSSSSFIVACPDQSEFCECPRAETVCEFTFRVEERFSFASYSFIPNTRQLSVNGGYLFSLERTGFSPSFNMTSQCGITGFTDLQEFPRNNCSIPMTLDGVNYRPLLLINGRIPGPTLVVTKRQTIVVHVLNHLESEGITIHWHGMFQKGTAWMDGVGFVTQPPIDAGSSFDYIFKAEPAGTHWYHSHVGSQKSDGLFGGLVIRELATLGTILNNSTYNSVVDNAGEHTFTIIDWQRKAEFLPQSLADLPFYNNLPIGQVPTNMDTSFPGYSSPDGANLGGIPFWSGLINGKGRMDSDIATPLSIFSVQRGSTFHFRMVGSISIYAFRVSVDGHKLKAIASDGEYFEPVEVDYMIIHAGETYDFLLEANSQEGTNFWIRADILADNLQQEQSARAILTYGNSSDLDWTTAYSNVPERNRTCTAEAPCMTLNCPFRIYPSSFNTLCVPLTSLVRRTATPDSDIPNFPPNSSCEDCMHFLNFDFQGANGQSSVNANSFQLPQTSYATNCFQYENQKNDNTTNTCNKCEVNPNSPNGCKCIDVVPIVNNFTFNEALAQPSVAMVFSGIPSEFSHPIHLHGHAYTIVYIGYGEYNESTGKLIRFNRDIDCGNDTLCTNPRWRNGIPQAVLNRTNSNGEVVASAIRKDTVMIPAGGYVVISFEADNPGYWIMHCHIEAHLLDGMAVIVQEYGPGQQWSPPPGINLHGSFNFDVASYNSITSLLQICSSPSTQTAPGPLSPSTGCVVSRAGFSVAMAVLAVLIVTVIVLIIVIILICCFASKKKGSYTPKTSSAQSHPTEQPPVEIELSSRT